MKAKSRGPQWVQRGCVTTTRENAQDMLDYQFAGIGYIYWFVSFYAVYTK